MSRPRTSELPRRGLPRAEMRPQTSHATSMPGLLDRDSPILSPLHNVPFTLLKDPLELARRGKTIELKSILPSNGGLSIAGLNVANNVGRTPLMVSCLTGKLDTMLTIIDAGADVESRDFSGKTVIFYAIAKRNIEAVKVLISKGADVEAIDNFGRTPLMEACMDGNLLAVKELLRAGAKIGAADNKGVLYNRWYMYTVVIFLFISRTNCGYVRNG
jgi:hypothetical protein